MKSLYKYYALWNILIFKNQLWSYFNTNTLFFFYCFWSTLETKILALQFIYIMGSSGFSWKFDHKRRWQPNVRTVSTLFWTKLHFKTKHFSLNRPFDRLNLKVAMFVKLCVYLHSLEDNNNIHIFAFQKQKKILSCQNFCKILLFVICCCNFLGFVWNSCYNLLTWRGLVVSLLRDVSRWNMSG